MIRSPQRFVKVNKSGYKAKVARDFGNGAVSIELKRDGRYMMFHWQDLTEISEDEYLRK